MKHIFCTILLFCITVNLKSQESNIDSLIQVKIRNGNVFELQEMYEKNKDNLSPLMRSVCEFNLAKAFNKSEESCKLLKYIISTYENQLSFKTMFYLYGELFSNVIETSNHDDYRWAFKSANKYIKKNSNNITKKEYDFFKTNLNKAKNTFDVILSHLSLKIKRNAQQKTQSYLMRESHPVITTEINGISFKTILDTGFNLPFIINKDVASKIGVKIHTSFKGNINGTLIDISQGFIDSIQIGRVKVYNLIANILDFPSQLKNLPDSIKNNNEIMQELKEKESLVKLPIIGLPLLKRMGQIVFNFQDNTVLFPCKNNFNKNTEHNIFTSDGRLYTKLEINKINSTILIDTGSEEFMSLTYDFFKKHKTLLPIQSDSIHKTLSIYMHTTDLSDEPDNYLLNPVIKYCDKQIQLNSDEEIEQILIEKKGTFAESFINKRDGMLGYSFLKSLGNKVLIDFDNMNIKILE